MRTGEEGLVFYFAFLIFIGWLLGNVAEVISEFIPYWIAGTVFLMPLYGYVKSHKGKRLHIAINMKYFIKGKMIPIIVIVISMAVSFNRVELLLINIATLSVFTLAFSAIVWTVVRFLVKSFKNFEIPTFYMAMKDCLTK